MKNRLRVGVLFGGRSGEHEISLLSAASILKAIDRTRFEVIPIGIAKNGRWLISAAAERLLNGKEAKTEGRPAGALESGTARAPDQAKDRRALPPPGEGVIVPASPGKDIPSLDVVFPVLHGTFGEDGTIQGLLDLAGLPYVGSGVLGSATGMDKEIMKRLFSAAGLPIVRHVTFLRQEWRLNPRKIVARLESRLRYPVFVKPANLGSSVGINKAHDRKELAPAIEEAAGYDRKIVVEQGVGRRSRNGKPARARELEVAVLGNDSPEASVVGEVVPAKEFYDYEAKYLTEGSRAIIPAKLTGRQTKQVRAMALAAFRACDCSGLARVDFLMEPTAAGKIYVNEINTMPGFTSISMYPKLWQASGWSYSDLISRLIELALERAAEREQTSYSR
jgi:D-alanine-D-alanine ligase